MKCDDTVLKSEREWLDVSTGIFGVELTYSPNKQSLAHYHIGLDNEAAGKLYIWLKEYFEDLARDKNKPNQTIEEFLATLEKEGTADETKTP